MNKIRVKGSNLYEIEVNDQGEKIVFNLSDVNLYANVIEMFGKIEKIQADLDVKIKEIDGIDKEAMFNSEVSKIDYETVQCMRNYFKECRDVVDSVFGDGACQKIFGDYNDITMFEDLFDQMQPHFKKMGLKMKDYKKKISEKYKKQDDEVLS